ncbi:MAG: hypothetical protein N3A54_06690, partial [Patescibacteria group bacterium]|nr:hypothetical protein [Patescibacteria group bacterium]
MILIYSDHHAIHTPPHEVFNGNREPHAEVPERIERIYTAIMKECSLPTIPPTMLSWEDIKNTHHPDYVKFIQNISNNDYLYPSVFRYRSHVERITHPVAQRGYYSFDTYTPISRNASRAALVSASLAATGARQILDSERVVYALCRPPGHHAEYDQMGGYCYINNAAVAATILKKHGT